MVANEKMKGSNGLENLLFPLPYLRVSQGEHSSTYYAMDFLGWGENGRIYNAPYYAPCTLKCVHMENSSEHAQVIWESTEQVNYIDGTVDYVHILVAHDDNITAYEGEIREQGALLGATGTSPAGSSTGDHLHMYIGKGKYTGWVQDSQGNWRFPNQYHVYNAMGINDTVESATGGFNWRKFSDEPTPPEDDKDFIVLSIVNACKWSI